MAWDSSRPVPWRRLIREWLIYVGIMAAVFLIFMRDNSLIGIMAGLLVSGPLYLAFGAVLAKFGYTRKTMKQLRTEAPVRGATSKAAADPLAPRPKPAPTKRTSGSGTRPKRR
ncbi:MAG TPA: hypothetical protein VMM60_01440 [Ilumatobacter sp.]|nr:hypothetical protein [Ilumatobacter sp.]